MAGIGHNGGPPMEEEEDDSPPTVEEMVAVHEAIRYLQWKVPNLEELLTKRKGGRILGWRLALANVLKDSEPRVRQNSLRQILKLNRKTMGENQQRADRWAEWDEENGDGTFSDLLARLRDAVISNGRVDVQALEPKLKAFVKLDPELRRLEEQQRAHEYASLEAETAAAELEARSRERKQSAKRLAEAKELRKTLKGVSGKDAIVAKHLGAKELARALSAEAIEVVKIITVAEAKGIRRATRAVEKAAGDAGQAGVRECIRLGLARQSQPYLAPPIDDPPLAPTEFGMCVFQEAVKSGRIEIKKRKASEGEPKKKPLSKKKAA